MRTLLAAAALTLTLVPVAQAGTTLTGTVGPGYTISLKTPAGKLVRTLKPGTYRIRVADRSGNHNFHLAGPGVDRATEIVYKGTTTWAVKLRAGRYVYKCDPHEIIMKGSFKVR